MGIKERKEKHKEDLRQRILDAAKILFLKDGYEATSIRKIAAAIEFSPTTIYLYYKDKTDILFELQKEGFKLLRSKLAVLSKVDDPFERLKAIGRGYLQFAFENPEFYELMFVMKEPLEGLKENEKEEWEDGKQTYQYLVSTLEECQRCGYFAGQDIHVFSMIMWSQVHGLATLSLHGHIGHVTRKEMQGMPEEGVIVDAAFESFIKVISHMRE